MHGHAKSQTKMNRNIMMTTLKAMIPIMILLAAACSREDEGSSSASTTPGRATIVIDSGSSTKAAATSANVDTTALVNSIRIYAFNSSGENVGYYYKDGLTSESSPYACVMELTEGGDLDFYVLVNDDYALVESGGDETTASDKLDKDSGTTDITDLSLTGLSVDDGEAYVPMANIQNGSTVDDNNFTYYIEDIKGAAIDKIIYIDVTRAMAKLSMFFAKTSGTDEVTIDRAVIYNGPETSPLYPTASDDGDEAAYTVTADNFGSTSGSTYFLGSADGTDPIKVTKINNIASGTAGRLSTSNLQLITSSAAPYGEAYLLPNPYGSSNADNFVSIGTDDTVTGSNPTHAYYVDLTYTINGTQKTKTIYLPVVTANDWIKIKGIFDYNTVDVEFAVTILSWDEHEMDISFD